MTGAVKINFDEAEKKANTRALLLIKTMPISKFVQMEYHHPKNEIGHIVEVSYDIDNDGALFSIYVHVNEMKLSLIRDSMIEVDCCLHEVELPDQFVDEHSQRVVEILKRDVFTYLFFWFRSQRHSHIREYFTAGPSTIDSCLSHEALKKLRTLEEISDMIIEGELAWEDMQSSYLRELDVAMAAENKSRGAK